MCSEKVLSFVNTFSLGTATGGLCRQAQGRSHTHTSFLQPFQILPKSKIWSPWMGTRSSTWAHSSPWNRTNREAKRAPSSASPSQGDAPFTKEGQASLVHWCFCYPWWIISAGSEKDTIILWQIQTLAKNRARKKHDRYLYQVQTSCVCSTWETIFS